MDRDGLFREKVSDKITNRRDFIKASAAAGTASFVTGTASSVHAASSTKNRKLRIGAIAVGETPTAQRQLRQRPRGLRLLLRARCLDAVPRAQDCSPHGCADAPRDLAASEEGR